MLNTWSSSVPIIIVVSVHSCMRVRECLCVCVSWRSHYISSDYSSTLFLCVLLASRAFTLLVHLISTKLGQWQQLLLLVPLTRPRRRQQLTDSVTPCVASSHSLHLAVSAALLINECIHEYFSGAYLNLKTTLGLLWLRGTGRQAGRKFWFFDFRDEQIWIHKYRTNISG